MTVGQSILHGDEGMWTLDNLPLGRIKELYGFEPPAGWSRHVMLSSVRMNNGGSGGFVSPHGLLGTNHHVARGVLDQLRTEERNLLRAGFYAERQEDEIPAPNLEVNVLQEIVDVTERVKTAIREDMEPSEAALVKRAVIAQIEKESKERTGLRSDVVTLYQGGMYHLYRYKRYTDVRLVFAPDGAAAKFGGDIDNYNFPRYCLDITFFRVYENGAPLSTPYYFKWTDINPNEGDLLFVAGHPGTTDRLSTLARIKHMRDSGLPYFLSLLYRKEVMAQQFGGQSARNAEIAEPDLYMVQNGRKRFLGQRDALHDPDFMDEIARQEWELRGIVNTNPDLAEYRDAWEMVDRAERDLLKIRDAVNMYEGASAFNSVYFRFARMLLRLSVEDQKPNSERLEEYRDSSRESLMQQLLSPAPIYSDWEEWKLSDSLAYLAEVMGFDDLFVRVVLAGKSPRQRAHELVEDTSLGDVDARKRLVGGGIPAVEASADPFIILAHAADLRSREARKYFEERVKLAREQAYAEIAAAKFAVYGDSLYPDATFTLRLAFGRVAGYVDNGVEVPCFTTVGGTFAHAESHNCEGDWKLSGRWVGVREEIEKSEAAYNFVTTHDTHGGNSGSPVFDANLRLVGWLFDGNKRANAGCVLYTDEVARSVSVHAAGILEVLNKVYHTDRLVEELTG